MQNYMITIFVVVLLYGCNHFIILVNQLKPRDLLCLNEMLSSCSDTSKNNISS